MKDFITILEERGFLNQCTGLDGLRVLSNANAVRPYVGFDLTADSLHVGSLIQLMVLRWAKATGTEATVLLGDFTTMVGDPTGRTESRPMLDYKAVSLNQRGIMNAIDLIVGHGRIVNNSEWLANMSLSNFLLDFGPSFSVNRMLAMDSVKSRIESQSHMSMLEFSYSMLQAIDFLELNRQGVNLQIGGSDQWSNIIMGVDLIRRNNDRTAYGLTTPLMTNSAGEKMGKTAGGAIWLTSDKTPVQDFYQFWRNIEDAKVAEFFRLFTELPLTDIDKAMTGDINDSKKRLAFEVTSIVHGKNAAGRAAREALAMFEGGDSDDIPLAIVATEMLVKPLSHLVAELQQVSKSEAARLIKQRAVKLDDTVIAVDDAVLRSLISVNTPFLLNVGKKGRYRLVCRQAKGNDQ